MRIAHVIWELETGGAETMLVDIVNEQIKTEKVAVFIVNNAINGELLSKINKRCKLVLINRKNGSKSLLPWIKLNLYLFRYAPDIIHLHLEGLRKMILHPSPKVFTIHNMVTTGAEFPKFKALYSISEAVLKKTQKQGYTSKLIWNGIIPEMIETSSHKTKKPQSTSQFVCVGRLYTPYKGQDVLINAIKLLVDRGVTSFHLYLIGEGDSREFLEGMINKHNLSDYVSLMGHKSREYVYSHLKDYDLFILPSRSEGFGLAVAEAMCAKIPVLVSNLEGPMEVIDKGNYGMFFKSEDYYDLAEKIELFLKGGVGQELIEKAYCYAKTNFNISNVATKYLDEYKVLLKRK